MKYKKYICIIATACLLGTAAFCCYQIYDHYAHEAEQTEVFNELAKTVQQPGKETPEVPYSEEENVLAEYGELFLQNSDMVGWISIADTTINYPVMQTKNNPNYYLKRSFEKEYSDLGVPYIHLINHCSMNYPHADTFQTVTISS